MTIQQKLTHILILLLIANFSFAQTNNSSKWIIDKKTYFTSRQIIESKASDTVIFLDHVSFHSDLLTIDSVDKIVYCKSLKKLSIGGSITGSIKFSKRVSPTVLTPITEVAESYSFDELEYVIGEHTYYLK